MWNRQFFLLFMCYTIFFIHFYSFFIQIVILILYVLYNRCIWIQIIQNFIRFSFFNFYSICFTVFIQLCFVPRIICFIHILFGFPIFYSISKQIIFDKIFNNLYSNMVWVFFILGTYIFVVCWINSTMTTQILLCKNWEGRIFIGSLPSQWKKLIPTFVISTYLLWFHFWTVSVWKCFWFIT